MKNSILLLFVASLLLMTACEKNDPEPVDYVVIDGLKWDKANTVIDGEQFFTFDEAQAVAAAVGKRLPTMEEFRALRDMGSTWDDALKGRWFGGDHALKGGSEKSVFLPAAGYREYIDNEMYFQGEKGLYWSGDYGDGIRNALSFDEEQIFEDVSDLPAGHSIRCVRD